MTHPFGPDDGLVVVQSELSGPLGSTMVRLAVDMEAHVLCIDFRRSTVSLT